MCDFKVHSYFDPPPSVPYFSDKPSMTEQQFKDDTDINVMISRFGNSAFVSDPLLSISGSKPSFGDFSDPVSYHDALNILNDAQEQFSVLPAKIRARFGNNPQEMLSFLNDPANMDEAVKLGLCNPKVSEVVNESVEGVGG